MTAVDPHHRFSVQSPRRCLMIGGRNFPRRLPVVFLLFLMAVWPARAEILFFDTATMVNQTIYLTVLTKGAFFPEGGRRAVFFDDGIELGGILTGGDGYGYLKFVPAAHGLRRIRVRAGADSDIGRLLVIAPGEKTVLIGIEGALRRFPFSREAADGARPALQKLATACPLIYVAGFTGVLNGRRFIDLNKLPPAPVLRWKGTDTFRGLARNGVDIYAVVGPRDVVSAAEGYAKKRFLLGNDDPAMAVITWEEIPEKILK